jgi:hypothetical protein
VLGTLIGEMDPTDANFPPEFFKHQAEFVRQPWGLSVARDRQALGQADNTDGAMAGEAWERILREGAGVPVIAEALFNVINLNRPPESLATDSEFLAAVNKLVQQPRPSIEAEDLAPYPPAAIAN